MYTPVNPVLLYKSGVLGGLNYIGMFSWCTRGLWYAEHVQSYILLGSICNEYARQSLQRIWSMIF